MYVQLFGFWHPVDCKIVLLVFFLKPSWSIISRHYLCIYKFYNNCYQIVLTSVSFISFFFTKLEFHYFEYVIIFFCSKASFKISLSAFLRIAKTVLTWNYIRDFAFFECNVILLAANKGRLLLFFGNILLKDDYIL